MVNQVLQAMVEYFGEDRRLTSHCLRVHSLAGSIGESERLSVERQQVLECAALLLDIGIPESIRTYGSFKGTYHEAMGYKVASELMTTLGFDAAFIEQVVFLIANHHSYHVDGGIALQILIEADFLVSLENGELGKLTPRQVMKEHFRTKMGREMLRAMYGLQPEPPKSLIETGFISFPELSRA